MIWSLRKPVMWVWRKLVGLVGAWTVAPIFRQAHDYHLAVRRWQRRWAELAENVEFQLHTRSSFDEDNNGEQSIWIRNSGQVLIDEVHFCVEAKLGSVSYQVPLAVYRLKPGCKAKLALVGLPLQDLIVHNDQVYTTYDSISTYPVRIIRNHHMEIYSTDGVSWHPTYGDYLNGEWRRWDGRLYNIKAIDELRRENFFRLAHSLCGRHGLFGLEFELLLKQTMRSRKYRRLPGVMIFALISYKPILNAIVWARLLLRVERIVFERDPATDKATEHVLNKGHGDRPVKVILIDAGRTAIEGST